MREFLDLSKLKFGQKLIAWCIFLILVLTLLSAFYFEDGFQVIGSSIDLLKLIATTALGFVFGRTKAADEIAKANEGD